MKSEKGVTLVALVLTIVVLLILAAVAIFMVMDGVYTDSKNETKNNVTVQNEVKEENTVNNTNTTVPEDE